MEYVRERGNYADVPYEAIIADFKKTYPRWMVLVGNGKRGDFPAEAQSENL